MKKIAYLLSFFLISIYASAQQDPIYALYQNNLFNINPAYAGSNNSLLTSLQYRMQWAGIAGNPVTVNFASHMSINKNKMGIGLQIISDVIGENKNTEIQLAYSYKLELEKSTLAFGMQAGVSNYTNDIDKLNIFSSDFAFAPYSEFQFNTGAGIFWTGDKFAAGVSAPRLLPSTVSQGGVEIQVYSPTLYTYGSYLFFISERIRFKPAFLLRATEGNPLSTDIGANFTFIDSFTAGLFTRNLNTYGLLLKYRVNKLQIGYVLEVPTSQSIGTRYTSHEFLISLRLRALPYHDIERITDF